MKKILAIILILASAYAGNAQSIWKPLSPQLKADKSFTPHADKVIFDTTQVGSPWQGFRFFGPSALYAYNFASQTSTIYTGVGIDYEWDTLSTATNRYYTKFAIGAGVYGGGNIAPTGIGAVAAVGIHIYLFNKMVALGALYNITQKTVQPAVGANANLIPTN